LSEIYFITSNRFKVEEVKPIADRYGFKIIQYSGFKTEIQSDELLKIAKTAALKAYMELEKPVLVEDAGLFVEVLKGFPGPYSNYVYRTIGINGLLKLLEGVENRRAYFKSVAVIVYEPYIIVSEGIVYGWITDTPRGSRGFGFDPVFIPNGSSKTFGEMSVEEKNLYSHRAKSVDNAFKKLVDLLNK